MTPIIPIPWSILPILKISLGNSLSFLKTLVRYLYLSCQNKLQKYKKW